MSRVTHTGSPAAWLAGTALVLAACGQRGPAGVYELDAAAIRLHGVDPSNADAAARAERTAAGLQEHFQGSIELRADGTASHTFQALVLEPVEFSGTWRLEGGRLTITSGDESQQWSYAPGLLTRTQTVSLLDLELTWRLR